MNNESNLTTVKISFEELEKDVTKVKVKHFGFNEDEGWNNDFDWHEMAWTSVLQSLKLAIENRDGKICCLP